MSNQPLATRMRPTTLSDVVGQDHLIGEGQILTRMVNTRRIASIILYGPPGIGKTSIAHALSCDLGTEFEYFNASFHAKKDLERVTKNGTIENPSVVLIDEVHRLTKPNQDFLLNRIEEGSIIMIGATTENPYMNINPALRSRSNIFELKPVTPEDVLVRLNVALTNTENGLGKYDVKIDDGVLEYIASFTNGDMRSALNTLELAVVSTEPNDDGVRHITQDVANTCLQHKTIDGDKDGDAHYNLLSAFQKSIRGSDTDASLHYLARLIKIGDLISINRRLLVIAYEDIGLANPQLVSETLNAIHTAERVGFPEARIPLAYITVRLALSPKSNVAYKALDRALQALEFNRNTEIPLHLHDTHYKGAKDLNKGVGYKYAHDYPNGITDQQHLPDDFSQDKYLQFRDETDTTDIQRIYHQINQIVRPNS